MQLVIDIGNTRIKAGVFNQQNILQTFVFKTIKEFINANIYNNFNISNTIICSVVNEIEDLTNFISTNSQCLIFKSDTPIPLNNLYHSKNTLGSDRIAASIGAYTLYPNKNVLVIDAGTCIKYNFTSSKNEYLGGAISPGIAMRFKSLSNYTARLPLLSLNENFDKFLGKTTDESIFSGVQIAAVHEMEGFIEQYNSNYENLTVVLTGGDANFFEKRLKKRIFADPFLILKGLNEIAIFNSK